MATAVKSRIIKLSDTDCRKITHAGVSDNIIHRLPSFDQAPVDEILDIRKELEQHSVDSFICGFRLAWEMVNELNHYMEERPEPEDDLGPDALA